MVPSYLVAIDAFRGILLRSRRRQSPAKNCTNVCMYHVYVFVFYLFFWRGPIQPTDSFVCLFVYYQVLTTVSLPQV